MRSKGSGSAAGAPEGRLELVQPSRKFSSNRPIPVVCERIFGEWLKGTSERHLSIKYRHPREVIEIVNREQARERMERRAA